MNLRWSHAVVFVRDLDAMVDFYGSVLGFEVADRGPLDPSNPGLEVAFLSQASSDHHMIAFAPVRGDGPPTTVDHFAFRVDGFDDVKSMALTATADDRATDIQTVNHGNAWSVYFKDPEGNGVEVFCDSPWHVQQPQFKLWDLSMDEDDLRAATQEQFGSEPEFQPMEDYVAARRRHFGR